VPQFAHVDIAHILETEIVGHLAGRQERVAAQVAGEESQPIERDGVQLRAVGDRLFDGIASAARSGLVSGPLGRCRAGLIRPWFGLLGLVRPGSQRGDLVGVETRFRDGRCRPEPPRKPAPLNASLIALASSAVSLDSTYFARIVFTTRFCSSLSGCVSPSAPCPRAAGTGFRGTWAAVHCVAEIEAPSISAVMSMQDVMT
jgi:hypothetical protein